MPHAELAEALVAQTIVNRSPLRRIVHLAREAGRLVGVSAVVKSKTELGEEMEIALTPHLAGRDLERYLDYAVPAAAILVRCSDAGVRVFVYLAVTHLGALASGSPCSLSDCTPPLRELCSAQVGHTVGQ